MNALDLIAERNPEALIADGFDDAIIGIAYRCGQDPVVAYDSQQILDILVQDGMTEDEAAEYYEFNIAGAYLGTQHPYLHYNHREPHMPAGRPQIALDNEQVYKYAKIGCTLEEIADLCGVSVDTIQRRRDSDPDFAASLKRGQAELRQSLRRQQITAANKGNVTMMIWLGKQLLGQRDKQEVDLGNKDDKPFKSENLHDIPTENLLKALELLDDNKSTDSQRNPQERTGPA